MHSLLTFKGFCLSVFCFVFLPPATWGQESQISPEHLAFFEAKIRPVLVAECYSCHSVEADKAGKLRGELLLDSRAALLAGGESGAAIVSGDPEDSLLISALRHESMEMPPKGKLSDEVIADFVKWVEMGAPDPREKTERVAAPKLDLDAGRKFWAFQPLNKSEPPMVDDLKWQAWNQHPVDRFVVAKQLEKQLQPSANAEPRALIRRAWFDLLGLPPTPEQMQHWLSRLTITPAPNAPPSDQGATINQEAWSELIKELLDQPQYGERWARHWMDVARFAESHGYEQDYDRPTAYHYRDFLIKAFNSDLPYEKFVQWQLAGDELATDEPLAWMATGFLGGGAFPTQLTEAEFESARYDELDDMVATTGLAFLGLSVGCARCHDHKFDPIGALDYYRMAATFTNAIRSEKSFDLEPEQNRKRQLDYDERLQDARAQLVAYDQEKLSGAIVEHLKSLVQSDRADGPWDILDGQLTSAMKMSFNKLEDQSYLATGQAPLKDEWTFDFDLTPGTYRSIRVEALSDPSLPQKGPGRGGNGNFALTDLGLELVTSPDGAKDDPASKLSFSKARATFEQNNHSLAVAASIDSDPSSGWAVDGKIGMSHAAVFEFAKELTVDSRQSLRLTLKFNNASVHHMIGRLRVSVAEQSDAPAVVTENAMTSDQRTATEQVYAAIAEGKSDDELRKIVTQNLESLKAAYGDAIVERKTLAQKLAEIESKGPGLQISKVLVTTEGLPHLPHHADGRGFPHFYPETHLLRRGDVHQKVEVVQPGLLRVMLPEGIEEGRWTVSADERQNPSSSYRRASLARWITDTEQGAGQLAARVMVNRLWQHHFGQGIVTTPSDFGVSGERPTNPELLDWLAKQLIENRWSLKKLHHTMMTSRTYLQGNKLPDDNRVAIDPENRFYWHRAPQRLEAEAIRDSMLAVSGRLDSTMYGPGTLNSAMQRRSVYFFIKRSQLIPEMMLFDWPEHLVSIGQRPRTTIAPQALMFINSPQGRAHAMALAKRVKSPDNAKSVQLAYDLTLTRQPSEQELALSVQFIEQQAALRSEQGESDAGEQALTDFCQMLLSMNEFIYVD